MSGIRVLFLSAVIGAGLGLLGSLAVQWFMDEPFQRWILFSLIPVSTAFVFHGVAVLGVHLWLRHRLRMHVPMRRFHTGRPALRADRDITFASDAALAHALDSLEETLDVKYIPNRLVETDRPWAYEAWAEVLADDVPESTYLMVPAKSRLRARRAGAGNLRQIEPKIPAAAVIIVPGQMTGKGAAAIAAADSSFCADVLDRLRSVAGA